MESPLVFHFTRQFKRAFRKLPAQIQLQTKKTLQLHTKKMQGTDAIWEVRITQSYRLTFQKDENGITLRHIGTHDVLRRE